MDSLIASAGLPLLFAVIAIESFGVPVPGETALIAAGVLAASGKLSIEAVVVTAAAAAIIGDSLGFWLVGRLGARRLMERWAWFDRTATRGLDRAGPVLERHGGKAVFLGRFVAVLRYTIAWIAGLSGMPWRRFLVANALGGAVWATGVALLAYYAGAAAADAVKRDGLYAVVVLAVLGLAAWLVLRRLHRVAARRL